MTQSLCQEIHEHRTLVTLRHMLRTGSLALIIADYMLRLNEPHGSPVKIVGTAINVIRQHPERGWRMVIANPQGTAEAAP
jgi:ketosteroid isomerase-like protein